MENACPWAGPQHDLKNPCRCVPKAAGVFSSIVVVVQFQHSGKRFAGQPRRARPVDEAAKARLAQRSVFCKRPPWRAAKIGKAQEARTATAASGRNREP